MRVVTDMYKSKYDKRVVCPKCNSVIDLEEEDIVLRSKNGIAYNTYSCPVCKTRNELYAESFIEDLMTKYQDLLAEYSDYKKTHPISIENSELL